MTKEVKYAFPSEALAKFNKKDVGTSLFCNSFYNGKKYGGLLLICDNALIEKLKIDVNQNINYPPEFAFRMFSSEQFFFTDYLFEFEVLFHGATEIVKMHLHQDTKNFRDFCKKTIQHKTFGVLFQNVDTGFLTAVYFFLQDDEDLEWLQRNFELSKTQLSGKLLDKFKQWDELSKYVKKQNKQKATYFLHNKQVDFLDVVREKSALKIDNKP